MAIEITVPTLGESVVEATIARWLKKAGDSVAADEPVVELETDKVTLEVPAPVNGTLSDIVASEGATVEVGALLARMEEGAAPAASAPAASAPKEEAPKAAAPAPGNAAEGSAVSRAPQDRLRVFCWRGARGDQREQHDDASDHLHRARLPWRLLCRKRSPCGARLSWAGSTCRHFTPPYERRLF